MKRTIKHLFYGLLATVCAASCNDAEYGVAETIVFLQESLGESGVAGQVTTIPEGGKDFLLTVALNSKATEDLSFRLAIDENALAIYNKEQSSEFFMMEKELFDLGETVTIKAGKYSADPIEFHINQIPEELSDRPMALPITLETVNNNVKVAPVTSKYVIAVSPILHNELAQFTGGAGLRNDNFTAFYPQNTIECRFQMSDSNNRNRFVFNNGHLDGRFEDPQNDDDNHKAHSLVQFHVKPDKYMNPELSFESNKWQHLAVTYDGTAMTVYVNGAFAGTKEYPVTNAGQFDFIEWFSKDKWWAGCKLLITEVRVWSVCRSQKQIQSNMKSVLPTSAGLEGYWRINKSSYNDVDFTFEDLTGKGHPLSIGLENDNSRPSTMKWIENVSSEDLQTNFK